MKKRLSANTIWFKDEHDVERRTQELQGYLSAFEDLTEIIDNLLKGHSSSHVDDYHDAAWAYKAADHNGYIRALRKVKDLLPKWEIEENG